MAQIEQLISNIQKINFPSVIEKSLKKIKPILEDEQRAQMLTGTARTGKRIGRYKSKSYAKYKFSLNTLAGLGNVDLKLTGELHRKIFADIRNSEVIMFSRDAKADELTKRYGDEIWGFDKQGIAYITKFLTPVALDIIKKSI